MKPLISILIPCFNAEAWVAETLESCLSQTWPNKEIILVDDGSTDNSLPIARRFEERGVKVLSKPNGGAASARNEAYRHAKGDYIQYIDADDLLEPHKIEQQIKALAGSKDMVATGKWVRFYTTTIGAIPFPEPTWRDFAPVEFLVLLSSENRMMHPAAWFVPRSITDAAGPWDERLSLDDDGEYFTRVVLKSAGVKFVPEALSYYRSGNTSSLSRLKSEKGWASQFLVNELIMKSLLGAENSPRTQSAMARRIQRTIYDSYPLAPNLRKQANILVKELGGTNILPEGGPVFKALRRMFGWKIAKRIQLKIYETGHVERKLAEKRRQELARNHPHIR